MLPFKPLAIAQFSLCALLVIGSVGPWVSAGFVSASGMDGDGVITLLCGFVIAGLTGLALGVPGARRAASWIAVFPAVLAVGVTIYDVINISTSGDEEYFSVSVGWGLWFALLASLGIVVVAVLLGIASIGSPTAVAAAPSWSPAPQPPSPTAGPPGPPTPPQAPPPPPAS